ncbi:flavohemoglobin expression-modulating QEGLA motif protein [Pararhizobium haloflavum]|uniref:flavohemoglobin expression-modulating QEGLA motif protein n=1 Tax=Pararhizobium haloflavum TaxID=2037914 RepID=UPI000C1A4637|nr:flavohemoglobin expression-modulating QEGLA motif protein [Pararhizobium haloflavum]
MSARPDDGRPARVDEAWRDALEEGLKSGKPVRLELEDGGRVHVDRPVPFVCVHVMGEHAADAARQIAMANASYVVAGSIERAAEVIDVIGGAMAERFGAFIVLSVDELGQDALLTDDAPYLPPFEIILSAPRAPAAQAAADAFESAAEAVKAKFRSPRIERCASEEGKGGQSLSSLTRFVCLSVSFAPIYRTPGDGGIYPALRERVVANIYDAGLKAIAAFIEQASHLKLTTHRALGRQVFVDAVRSADRSIDEIASMFDFLLAATPINSAAAWQEFQSGGYQREPRLLYRPLTIRIDEAKRRLFSIPFDHFEDPVLHALYREKQQELDLQLTMLAARDTPRFREVGRALYGSVRSSLQRAAHAILRETEAQAGGTSEPVDHVDCHHVASAAAKMIERYNAACPGFDATIELRDDLPAGLMVSGRRLLIARDTMLLRNRVEALLSHEIGVHLLTYFNGSSQGLWIFRSGLAGYEGVQEGLAVFAEYLVGGMTVRRLRLVAARVVACAAMLDGAAFQEVYDLLVKEHGFSARDAFGICVRVHRSGGLAKDAIYLRGLYQVLDHLRAGGALEPFWMGKIAASHFHIMQELGERGLLKAPVLTPLFLNHSQAEARLQRARDGLSPVDMAATEDF